MVSAATGLSPFMCSLGYQPPLFPSQETEAAVPSVQAHLRQCRWIWQTARDAMTTSRDRVERTANRRRVPASTYRPGQRVWLLARDIPLPAMSRKLAPCNVGPYTISQVINPSALWLTLPPSLKIHPHVSQVKLVASCPLSPPAPVPPPPRVLKGGDLVWEVNRILEVRRRGRRFHYLVDWVGYRPEDRSWVPSSYLADPTLLEDFYRANPQAIGRSPGVSCREGGPVVGAAGATPTSLPACSGEHAGNSINSQTSTSSTCNSSTLPTRASRDQRSGQKRS